MEQKRKRAKSSSRPDGGNSTRNVRSINNSREVSRRSKGRNRYEDEPRRVSKSKRQYDDYDDYDSVSRRKAKKRRPEEVRDSGRKRSSSYDNESAKKNRRRRGRRKKNGISKTLGIILAIIQFVLSVVLVVNVLFFDMLTSTYVMVVIGILTILFGITLLTQIGAKGKGIGGKIFCIFMCIVLGLGSFYISKVNNVFQKITGADTRKSSMVVSVLKDNSAEKISDAAGYNFGVQYATGGDQVTSAINQIQTELGGTIQTTEYSSLPELETALSNGEVDAMIYNSAYTSMLEEQNSEFSNETKTIYKHDIVVEIENEQIDASMSEPFAVYLSGIDVWGDITEDSRSDVNIIAVVNPTSHQVLLITTPRDYYVPIPGISGGQNDKLTHAGLYGVNASMATLGQLYEMEVPFFGRVNFTSMVQVVDALGGLDVESDTAFTTSADSEHVMDVQEGLNHFNGEEALAFCRERHNLADGDNARGRHQQAVITAIIKKMMSPAMLRGATDIISSVSDGVQTNFSTEQIQALIKTQLRTNAAWNIYSVSAEGYADKQTCYSSGDTLLYVTQPDETSIANIIDLVNRVEAGEVLEGSTTTN